MIQLAAPVDIAALRQRLFRLIWSSIALQQSTIKILERLTIHLAPPESVDVAETKDRLAEIFNSYAYLTKVILWDEDDQE